jgi:hypothetical protein
MGSSVVSPGKGLGMYQEFKESRRALCSRILGNGFWKRSKKIGVRST